MTSVSAEEAAQILGVTRQTLYAYVSRGLIRLAPGSDHKQSRYLRSAVETLAADRKRSRRPAAVARASLDWGLPVLETRLTCIENERLYYRGVDAVTLSRTATLEEVACLLWQVDADQAFGMQFPGTELYSRGLTDRSPGAAFKEELISRFSVASRDEDTAEWRNEPGQRVAGCGGLVRILTASMLGTEPSAAAIHEQCAAAWKLNSEAADVVRQALVLCADHELNASSFTARCIASTGASLRAAVIGGLAALSGGRHGGMTSRIELFWDGIEGRAEIKTALCDLLSSGIEIPGFGHPLYPSGDSRAAAILERLALRLPMADTIAAAVAELTGRLPSLDFALVALRRALALPRDAGFGIFALGRSVGWIAQALEQRAEGSMIRPRAVYVGVRPAATHMDGTS